MEQADLKSTTVFLYSAALGFALGFLPCLPLKMNCDPEVKRTQSINNQVANGLWTGMGWSGIVGMVKQI